MNRNQAHLWISIGVLVPLLAGVIVFDLVGFYFLAWTCGVALFSFGVGRLLWAAVELHYARREFKESVAETGKTVIELVQLRQRRLALMRELLVKGRQNGNGKAQ